MNEDPQREEHFLMHNAFLDALFRAITPILESLLAEGEKNDTLELCESPLSPFVAASPLESTPPILNPSSQPVCESSSRKLLSPLDFVQPSEN